MIDIKSDITPDTASRQRMNEPVEQDKPVFAQLPILARLGVSALAILCVMLIFYIVMALAPSPPPTQRAPFGMSGREISAPATGLSGIILAWQGQFYQSLTKALQKLTTEGGIISLIWISFAYGVFHAAGPGHGKAIISAYLVADGKQWFRGVGLSLAAALVQAGVAIAVVGLLVIGLKSTALTISATTRWIEIISYLAISMFGLWLIWRQSGRFVQTWRTSKASAHEITCEPGCSHIHLHEQGVLSPQKTWRETFAVVLSAGARPCTGAIIVLVFASSQGILLAGIAATFMMALGTALTTSLLAALAVVAKRTALSLAGGNSLFGVRLSAGLELLAAAFVLALGAALLTGVWSVNGPS